MLYTAVQKWRKSSRPGS